MMGGQPDSSAGENGQDEHEADETFRRSPPSPSRADGPPDEPYADSPGASIDTDEPVEPNEPA